jgi:hypothetical protein
MIEWMNVPLVEIFDTVDLYDYFRNKNNTNHLQNSSFEQQNLKNLQKCSLNLLRLHSF